MRDADEVGHHAVVENIFLQAVQHGRAAVDDDAFGDDAVDVFEENRQRGRVIEMRVRQEDVANLALGREVAVKAEAAGVDGHGVVHHVAR